MLTESHRERTQIVLVSPRNPLNIGAVARAMANFGFANLAVVSPYEPHWREARSAVGAPELLSNARETTSLSEALSNCTLAFGTGTLNHRKPEQPVIQLNDAAPILMRELDRGGRVSLVFGPEKHGLTREDLSYCHTLIEIPTDPRQPSMNLGQAVAVCLYELSTHAAPVTAPSTCASAGPSPDATSGNLDILASLIEEVMTTAEYSPKAMRAANRHDLRLMLRRLHFSAADSRRALGLFRRILWRFKRFHP